MLTFVFQDAQLVGLRHLWKFDEFFGSFVIEQHDGDRDGRSTGVIRTPAPGTPA